MKTVLGFDPGPSNFAWGFSDGRTWKSGCLNISKRKKKKLEEILEEIRPQLVELLDRFSPDQVIIERFQARGSFAVFANEVMNVVIGSFVEICRQREVPLRLVTPPAWKNDLRRTIGLSPADISLEGISQHECDALGMVAYELGSHFLKLMLGIGALEKECNRVFRTGKKLHKKLT